jgi:exopolyphosphatase / guanosine-5'-triphosphate,3'-diphosphate pyrophosphatase
LNTEKVAAIDIGSSSIRMTICEVKENEYNILDELRQPVKLGRDCFYNGKIERDTIDESLAVLRKFKRLCDEYGVKRIKAVATTALLEASNFDTLIDNIRSMTDIEVEVLTPSKESEYIYRAFDDIVAKDFDPGKKTNWAIIEVGAGNVEVIILEDKYILFSRSLPLGTLRIKQMFNKVLSSEGNFYAFLNVIIEHEFQNLKRNIPQIKIDRLYCIGFEIEELGKILAEKQSAVNRIERHSLEELIGSIQNYSDEEISEKLNVPYNFSDTFFSSSFIFLKIIAFFNTDEIFIPRTTLRNGIIKSLFYNVDESVYFATLEKQLLSNSINIGRSLNFDEKHGLKVMDLALKIFDQTKAIHNLGNLERCYLLVASLLHDIGASISYRSHHKHSLYIISEQDLFSFGKSDVKIVANIARYHRKSPPKDSHPEYMSLSHKERMTVTKLASILRMADGLDNTHLQLVEELEITKKESGILMTATVNDRFYPELYSFKQKKDLFEDFFGITIELRIIEK